MSGPDPREWFDDVAGDLAVDAPAIRSLLVATDLSEPARQAVERVAQLSAQHGTPATLFHVDTAATGQPKRRFAPLRHASSSSAQELLNRVASELEAGHGIELRAETRRGDVCEQILRMSATSDLLALSSTRRHPLHRLVFGSIPGRLLDRCRRPMLVVKQPPQGPYRRVLVLTDFSTRSLAAARLAAWIAPAAQLHLFHAIGLGDETEMRFAQVPESVVRQHRIGTRAAAQRQMDRAMASIGAGSTRFAPAFGHGQVVPLARLKQEALDADLLVVARSGGSTVGGLRLWNVARRVSDDCPCDVLVVPEAAALRSTDGRPARS